MGVSGGGPHALACAFTMPNRVTAAAVMSCVAPASMPGFLHKMMRFNREQATAAQQGAQAHAQLISALVGLLRDDPWAFVRAFAKLGAPQDVELLDAMPAAAQVAFVEAFTDLGQQSGRGWTDDFSALVADWGFPLQQVSTRVHIWHGHHDRNVPPTHADFLADQLPNATLMWFEDAGHLAVDQLALVVTDLIKLSIDVDGLSAS